MKRHDSPEDLQRRIAKLVASNARYKARVKKLRQLLDERTERLQDLWGLLTDVHREVGYLRPVGEPGDWDSVVDQLRLVVEEYRVLHCTVKTQRVRYECLVEELKKHNLAPPSRGDRVQRFLDWFKRRT